MSPAMIEHRGVVQRIEAGRAWVVMETAGCSSCGQGHQCGIGKLAAGRPATVLRLPADPALRAGDPVCVALPESRLTLSACLGYLFPALAMIFGAWLGAALGQSDGATALGAMLGFMGALVIARIAIGLMPSLLPAPRLIPLSDISDKSSLSSQELQHEH